MNKWYRTHWYHCPLTCQTSNACYDNIRQPIRVIAIANYWNRVWDATMWYISMFMYLLLCILIRVYPKVMCDTCPYSTLISNLTNGHREFNQYLFSRDSLGELLFVKALSTNSIILFSNFMTNQDACWTYKSHTVDPLWIRHICMLLASHSTSGFDARTATIITQTRWFSPHSLIVGVKMSLSVTNTAASVNQPHKSPLINGDSP